MWDDLAHKPAEIHESLIIGPGYNRLVQSWDHLEDTLDSIDPHLRNATHLLPEDTQSFAQVEP